MRVPPGIQVARRLAALPRCQSDVQEEGRALSAAHPQLCLVLQLKVAMTERDDVEENNKQMYK